MRYLATIALVLGLIDPAHGQLRTIPQEAKRGEIRHLHDMLVELDGRQRRLSPGAQIHDANNRLVLPLSLTEKSQVKYLLDGSGMVHRVWILSTSEEAQADKPVTLPAFK